MEVLKILRILTIVRPVDMDVDGVPLLDLFDEIEGFLEMVERIEEDERWWIGCYFGEHIDADEACETKGGRLVQSGEILDSPSQDFVRWESAQVRVDSIELRSGERELYKGWDLHRGHGGCGAGIKVSRSIGRGHFYLPYLPSICAYGVLMLCKVRRRGLTKPRSRCLRVMSFLSRTVVRLSYPVIPGMTLCLRLQGRGSLWRYILRNPWSPGKYNTQAGLEEVRGLISLEGGRSEATMLLCLEVDRIDIQCS